jgi:peptidoglycan/LPS O-acetylase OafA/YrhL
VATDGEILGTTAPTAQKERYWPALDGLRAIAVLLVLCFHTGVAWLGGGYVGVDIFFVLSGFLITTVLAQEWDRTNRIRLGRFYLRRVLRLYPALIVAVLGSVLIAAAISPGLSHDNSHAAPVALTYSMNWWWVAGNHSQGMLAHTWSLGVEEQFYLLWAPVLIVALKIGRSFALTATAALTVFFAIYVAGFASGWSVERMYLGTDARAPQLLIGATAALLLSNQVLSQWRTLIRMSALVGAGYLAVVAVGLYSPNGRGLPDVPVTATLLIGIAAMAIIACLTDPPQWCAVALESQPLVALGRISYGVYLWHIPMMYVAKSQWPTMGSVGIALLVATGSVAAAAASYHLVELRFLRLKRSLT